MSPSSRGGFSVSWTAHSGAIASGLQELQQRSEFVDMTIAADGHLVRVHQLVIGLASPYLKELIRSAPTPHPVIFLNNVSNSVLCCILEYIYTGEVVVPADDLKNFLITGRALHIKGLEEMMFQEKITPKTKHHKQASPDVVEAATTLENISSGQLSKLNANIQIYAPELSDPSVKTETYERSMIRNVSIKRPALQGLNEPNDDKNLHDDPEPASKLLRLSEYDGTEVLEDVSYSDEETFTQQEELSDEISAEHEESSYSVKSTLDSIENSQLNKNEPEITYTISNMGGIQLILNRFMYRMRNKYKDGRRRWQCVNYNLTKCTATTVTQDNKVLSRESFHNHPFHDKKIMTKVKNGLVYTSIKNVPPSSQRA